MRFSSLTRSTGGIPSSVELEYEVPHGFVRSSSLRRSTGGIPSSVELEYEIPHGDVRSSSLSRSTGGIPSSVELEYEVRVRDGGSPSLSAVARLTIIIVDVDDCPAQFTQSVYVFDVVENCRPGIVVGRVSASDDDSWPFNVVRLSRGGVHKGI